MIVSPVIAFVCAHVVGEVPPEDPQENAATPALVDPIAVSIASTNPVPASVIEALELVGALTVAPVVTFVVAVAATNAIPFPGTAVPAASRNSNVK